MTADIEEAKGISANTGNKGNNAIEKEVPE